MNEASGSYKTFPKEKIFDVPLEQVIPDADQPRKYFDEQALRELAESIKAYGLLQPILVRPNRNGGYNIVHGERRYRAHKMAGLPTIKCIVQELPDSTVSNVRLVENTARADLSDMELAYEFQKRVDAGETHEQIAKAINKSRGFVSQRLALLRLPEERQHELEQGKIGFAEARVLASLNVEGTPKNQHGYAVTMEKLEVYRLFKQNEKPALDVLYQAYRKDLATIRKAIHGGPNR
jgi:ParB family chromosome partitioning protein